MTVLIGCEYSGAVRDAFLAAGHDAYSCDILPTETCPERHFQEDVFAAIARQRWGLIMLHPPCTAIALCGNRWYGRGMKHHALRLAALEWTERLWDHANKHADRVGLENPKNVLGARIGKHNCTIHPWEFGHPEQKETWLWLRGLPPLAGTKNVYDEMMRLPRAERERVFFMGQSPTRGLERARTFSGIADAMAAQWSPGPELDLFT